MHTDTFRAAAMPSTDGHSDAEILHPELHPEPVKFIALDQEDLAVVSAHVQDAAVRVGDVIWQAREQRLVIPLNRFDWMAAECGGHDLKRCRSVLRFERVSSLKCRHVDPAAKERVLNLLAVEFEMLDAPSGCVQLTFSDDVVLRVQVECLEAELADLGPVWPAAARPIHLADDADIEADHARLA